MIKLIIENTDCFMNAVPKAKRKKYGQFFTNVTTALYMASLFDFDTTKPQISLAQGDFSVDSSPHSPNQIS